MTGSLTILANVNSWLGLTTNDDGPMLLRLISQASRMIHGYLQRPSLFQQTYNDVYDGTGSRRQMLRNWPVLSVASVTDGLLDISASSAPGQAGWWLEPSNGIPPGSPQALNLRGYTFCRGLGNVAITYTAGYVVQDEAQSIPTSAPYQIKPIGPYGIWGDDQGVTYADGTPLTKVASNPAAGQYAVTADPIAGASYWFNAADLGATVLLTYSFIPFDIEQLCIEWVAERYRYKERIGQTSKSLGGQETASYSLKDMPDFIATALQPYKNVLIL